MRACAPPTSAATEARDVSMLPPFLLIPLVLAGLLAVALLLRRLAGQEWLRSTILEAETSAGKAFDTVLHRTPPSVRWP